MFASQLPAAPKWYGPPDAMTTKNVYDSPMPQASERLALRVTLAMKLDLDALGRLWRLYAQARGDEETEISEAYVAKRLLAFGLDHAFDQMGLKDGRPKDDKEWAMVEESIERLGKALAEESKKEIENFVEKNAQLAAAKAKKK